MIRLFKWIYNLGFEAAINEILRSQSLYLSDESKSVIKHYYFGDRL